MDNKWIEEPLVRWPYETAEELAYRVREVKNLKLKCLERSASVEELHRLLVLTKPTPRWP